MDSGAELLPNSLKILWKNIKDSGCGMPIYLPQRGNPNRPARPISFLFFALPIVKVLYGKGEVWRIPTNQVLFPGDLFNDHNLFCSELVR